MRIKIAFFTAVIAVLTGPLAAPAGAWNWSDIQRVSLTSVEAEANGDSSSSPYCCEAPALSGDGRYVAFTSRATNVVRYDTNETADVFVRDRYLNEGTTTRVSVATGGLQANGPSWQPAISDDGRYVAFTSTATNLGGDTNGHTNVYLHDRHLGTTVRVSVNFDGSTESMGCSSSPSISSDGRYVSFASSSLKIVPSDTNLKFDVFVRDMQTGQNTRVSVDSFGVQANDHSDEPAISADGRFVAFQSKASNLASGEPERVAYIQDVFRHDRVTGSTVRVSIGYGGAAPNNGSWSLSISDDGTKVAFDSLANNLVQNDTNGDWDVFVWTFGAGTPKRVSVKANGTQSAGAGGQISGDGTRVIFGSYGRLVDEDHNGLPDVYVRNLTAWTTTRVSVTSNGSDPEGASVNGSLTTNGKMAAFWSWATDLVPGDTNGMGDVFVSYR